MNLLSSIAMATTLTVQEQEPKYKYIAEPSEKAFIQESRSKDNLVSNMILSLIQGVDTNPLLDSTKKADNYTEEILDMHFKYPLFGPNRGFTNSKFGFNITNINYYNITDVDIFDGVADVKFEQEISRDITLSAGYTFELLWFPSDENGNFIGNEINASAKQKLTDKIYQKCSYKLVFKNFLERKARLGNANFSSNLRSDIRNVFEYELGAYIINDTKVRVIDQFYISESNDQYFDFYDYINNRVGVSMIQLLVKKLYNITGFYYQRRNYDARKVSDRDANQRDNLYIVTTSFLYDVTKDISIFVNYSHAENHTNEPLEKYSNNIYSTGLHYSF